MQRAIIADASPLIALDNIDELHLLPSLYSTIIITPTVADEFSKPLPAWMKVQSPRNTQYQTILEVTVDKGEASAIALAIESENSLLLIDDLQARKLAQKLGLHYTGTLGIILEAKRTGEITSVAPVLQKPKKAHFFISEKAMKAVLLEAKE